MAYVHRHGELRLHLLGMQERSSTQHQESGAEA
jgi:hypothetical protein